MLRTRAGQILTGALVGYFAASVVIAGDEQQRAVDEARSHREAVDTGARRTVSDAAPRESVSDAALRKSVSDAAPRESVSDAKVQHTEIEAKATGKLPEGKIRGEVIKTGDGSETSIARDDKQDGLEDKEPRD